MPIRWAPDSTQNTSYDNVTFKTPLFIDWMDNETVWITPFVSNCQLLQV